MNIWSGSVPESAIELVKICEKFRAAPYDDNGNLPGGRWTIGWGTTIDARGNPVTANTPVIMFSEAKELLLRDLTAAATHVQLQVKVPLFECQAAGLISWTYNCGPGNLARSTMLALLNKNNYAAVPIEMSKWMYQGTTPLLGLRRRRWAEAAVFLGIDPQTAYNRAWAEVKKVTDWPVILPDRLDNLSSH